MFSLLAACELLLSSSCQGQLKYVGDNKGATMLSASYSSSPTISTMEADIDITRDGHFGIGASYAHAHDPQINIFGVQAEYALLRPKNELGVGTNLQAAIAITRTTIQYPTEYFSYGGIYSPPPEYLSGRSAGLGAEVYLHNPVTDYRVEPFVQFARTFASVSTDNSSPSTALNSLAVGTDLILGSTGSNFVVLTFGLIVEQHTQNAFALNFSFIHGIK